MDALQFPKMYQIFRNEFQHKTLTRFHREDLR